MAMQKHKGARGAREIKMRAARKSAIARTRGWRDERRSACRRAAQRICHHARRAPCWWCVQYRRRFTPRRRYNQQGQVTLRARRFPWLISIFSCFFLQIILHLIASYWCPFCFLLSSYFFCFFSFCYSPLFSWWFRSSSPMMHPRCHSPISPLLRWATRARERAYYDAVIFITPLRLLDGAAIVSYMRSPLRHWCRYAFHIILCCYSMSLSRARLFRFSDDSERVLAAHHPRPGRIAPFPPSGRITRAFRTAAVPCYTQ